MTQTRLPHPSARPALTGGDDQPPTPCRLNFLPWDVMLTHREGTQQHEAAKRDAAAICARCDLMACEWRAA